MTASTTAEDIVQTALRAVDEGDERLLAALDELSAPLYVTDPTA